QGSPGERLSLYRAALARTEDGARRRELLHTIARIQRRDMNDPRGAAETLTALVGAHPEDFAALEALVDAVEAAGDGAALVRELRRASELAPAEQRSSLKLRLSRAEVRAGEAATALERYRGLLLADELP